MSPDARAWRRVTGGIELRVRVTPRSSRDIVDGLTATADGPAVRVYVRAVPKDGTANVAIGRVVADWLGVPRSRIALASGAKSRVKVLAVEGDADELGRRIDRGLGSCRSA